MDDFGKLWWDFPNNYLTFMDDFYLLDDSYKHPLVNPNKNHSKWIAL